MSQLSTDADEMPGVKRPIVTWLNLDLFPCTVAAARVVLSDNMSRLHI